MREDTFASKLTKKMKKQIKFADLSTPLKVAVVGGWLYLFFFMIGFIIGFATV